MTRSLLALLLANAVPIIGVLFLGWTVFPLLLLYWVSFGDTDRVDKVPFRE